MKTPRKIRNWLIACAALAAIFCACGCGNRITLVNPTNTPLKIVDEREIEVRLPGKNTSAKVRLTGAWAQYDVEADVLEGGRPARLEGENKNAGETPALRNGGAQ